MSQVIDSMDDVMGQVYELVSDGSEIVLGDKILRQFLLGGGSQDGIRQ
jgi:hypothetical protein